MATLSKVRIVLTGHSGNGQTYTYETSDGSGKLNIIDASSGEIGFIPSELDTVESPYVVRFWIYYTSTQREPAPPDNSETLVVYPNYGG